MLVLAIASVALNLLDPLIQLFNGVDLFMEAAKTSSIEVTIFHFVCTLYIPGDVPSVSEGGFLALQRQTSPS